MAAQQEIILSGTRPTGRLHYGNYFGAITDRRMYKLSSW